MFKLKEFKLSSAQQNNKPRETRNKMKTIPHSILLALASVALYGTPALRAADIDPKIAEITKTAEAFVDAFHKGDAKAVAAFWTPDGDFINENSRVLKGRQAIEDSFERIHLGFREIKKIR